MSAPKRPSPSQQLERIEDALVESILNAGEGETHAVAGEDAQKVIAEIDAVIASARMEASRQRLERAREDLSTWRTKGSAVTGLQREAARSRFERLRSGESDPDAKLMMAARKGKGLSQDDVDGLIEDMAELEQLERDSDDR
jgi:hypothetical protein